MSNVELVMAVCGIVVIVTGGSGFLFRWLLNLHQSNVNLTLQSIDRNISGMENSFNGKLDNHTTQAALTAQNLDMNIQNLTKNADSQLAFITKLDTKTDQNTRDLNQLAIKTANIEGKLA